MNRCSGRFHGLMNRRMNPEDLRHQFGLLNLSWLSLHCHQHRVGDDTELLRKSHVWNARGPGGRDGRRGGLNKELEHAHLSLNEIYLRTGRGERLL